MKSKQLFFLFFCNFVTWFVGMGLLPVLPLYASRFGATPTMTGFYLAFTYFSITIGTMSAGELARKMGAKRVFIGGGLLGIPALALLGQAAHLWQVVLLTAIVWFCGGIGLALVSVFTGLYADNNQRGRSFGLTWLAFPLASVIGGLTVGQLVAWQGYPVMFAVLALIWVGWPLTALLMAYKPLPQAKPSAQTVEQPPLRLGSSFYVILLATLLSATAIYTSRLGMSLSMQSLHFSARAVASTASVGGLVTIPITLLIGPLSDRLGRRQFLIMGYLVTAAGALTLGVATQLWHFWLASGLIFISMCVNGAVAPALVTDMLAPEALSGGLSWFNGMTRIAGIIGFAGAGYLVDNLGTPGLSLIAATLFVSSALLLWQLLRRPQLIPPSPQWRQSYSSAKKGV